MRAFCYGHASNLPHLNVSADISKRLTNDATWRMDNGADASFDDIGLELDAAVPWEASHWSTALASLISTSRNCAGPQVAKCRQQTPAEPANVLLPTSKSKGDVLANRQ